jgi:hypothetical protein
MPEEKLIDPAWLVQARKNRRTFAFRVVLVFLILSVLAWWALPRLAAQYEQVGGMHVKKSPPKVPVTIGFLATFSGIFKALWAAIGIGSAAAIVLGFTGKIDTLVPILNLGLLLVGVAAVGLTIYVFYAPALILIEGVR